MRGDFSAKYLEQYNRFVTRFCKEQNIAGYFMPDTEIAYRGDGCDFVYSNGHFHVERMSSTGYDKPQIAYIPAERNLLSAIEGAENVRKLPAPLSWMRRDFEKALRELNGPMRLPVDGVQLVYDKQNKIPQIQCTDGSAYKIRLSESSSGIQSVAPLYVVLSDLVGRIGRHEEGSRKENEEVRARVRTLLEDDSLSMETRKLLIEQLPYNACKRLLAIVEEPEQNLFPSTQRELLYGLLDIANRFEGNSLLLTTHSPYLIDYLTLAIKARQVADKAKGAVLLEDVSRVVPQSAWVRAEDVAVYQMEQDGTIGLLGSYNGLPLDSNQLNAHLAETNEMFDALLDIEEAC